MHHIMIIIAKSAIKNYNFQNSGVAMQILPLTKQRKTKNKYAK